MEYAAVFLLFSHLVYCAMHGIAQGRLPRSAAPAAALALSMCVPTGRVCASFFVAAAVGICESATSRSVIALLDAAACGCVFALAGEAAFGYSSLVALSLSLVLSAAFATRGADIVCGVTVGSVIADMYSLFASKSGFLRCMAMGMHTAYYLIFAAVAAAIFDSIARARRPSQTLELTDFCSSPARAGGALLPGRVRV